MPNQEVQLQLSNNAYSNSGDHLRADLGLDGSESDDARDNSMYDDGDEDYALPRVMTKGDTAGMTAVIDGADMGDVAMPSQISSPGAPDLGDAHQTAGAM